MKSQDIHTGIQGLESYEDVPENDDMTTINVDFWSLVGERSHSSLKFSLFSASLSSTDDVIYRQDYFQV